ncbi:hypothetical protein AV650_28535 (plasmid) [Serratia fonticola]|nr:hypothetical protein AV650_28535 [Serratia fonticola]
MPFTTEPNACGVKKGLAWAIVHDRRAVCLVSLAFGQRAERMCLLAVYRRRAADAKNAPTLCTWLFALLAGWPDASLN